MKNYCPVRGHKTQRTQYTLDDSGDDESWFCPECGWNAEFGFFSDIDTGDPHFQLGYDEEWRE